MIYKDIRKEIHKDIHGKPRISIRRQEYGQLDPGIHIKLTLKIQVSPLCAQLRVLRGGRPQGALARVLSLPRSHLAVPKYGSEPVKPTALFQKQTRRSLSVNNGAQGPPPLPKESINDVLNHGEAVWFGPALPKRAIITD